MSSNYYFLVQLMKSKCTSSFFFPTWLVLIELFRKETRIGRRPVPPSASHMKGPVLARCFYSFLALQAASPIIIWTYLLFAVEDRPSAWITVSRGHCSHCLLLIKSFLVRIYKQCSNKMSSIKNSISQKENAKIFNLDYKTVKIWLHEQDVRNKMLTDKS